MTNTDSAIPSQRPVRKRFQDPHAGQLHYPPIRNGVDYLQSVVDLLGDYRESEPRDVKYAVLHLQAAAEVLLKTYLLHEHWTLVLAEPGKTSRKAFDSGDFSSCTMNQAIERLGNVAGITFSDKDREALKNLNDDRNRLQHYGLTHSAKVVEARAAKALDVLARFLDEHLLPRLSSADREEIHHPVGRVREGLKEINSFVKQRMNRLRGELAGQEARTLLCWECDQPAFVVGPRTATCHFCAETFTGTDVLLLVLHSSWEEGAEPCPSCDARTLFQNVPFMRPAVPGLDYWYCFTCDSDFALLPCERCQRPVEARPQDADQAASQVLCADCVGHAYHPDEHQDAHA